LPRTHGWPSFPVSLIACRIAEGAAVHVAQTRVAAEPSRIPDYTIELDIIEKLLGIYDLAERLAKTGETQEPEGSWPSAAGKFSTMVI
jgi:hypothetical protein